MNLRTVIQNYYPKFRVKRESSRTTAARILVDVAEKYVVDLPTLFGFAKSAISYITPNSGLKDAEKAKLNEFFRDFIAASKVTEEQKENLEKYFKLRIADAEIPDHFKQQLEEYFKECTLTHVLIKGVR